MTKNVLTLDIGTQSIRAAVVNVGGDIRGIAQCQHEVDSPHPNWAQQRPDGWWNDTCRAVRDVLKNTGAAADSIAAVATCGQMHGPVGIDELGNVTTPWVQLWCDKRCQAQCESLRQESDESRLAAIAANPINPAWTGLKVRWLKDTEPENYERTCWFLVPKDFINFKLTGVAAADPSEASGSFLWDCETDDYSAELAAAVGVDVTRFAPVRASHAVIGAVTGDASALTGLPEGTPVVAGGGDFPASMLGFGIVGEGATADVTGTSTLLASSNARPVIHPAIQNLRHVVDGWIPFTIIDCGGLSMKWCKDMLGSLGESGADDVSFDSLVELAARAPAGSDGLLFYPYMLGERRRENVKARGGWCGLTLNHMAPHIVRAVMEGVALALGRDVGILRSLGVEIDRVFCVGGGARNDLWNQIKADILQLPLVLTDEPEAGLKGAALLGAAGAGLIQDPAAVALERRASHRVIEPRPENRGAYEAALGEFVRLYDHMLGYWATE